MDLNKGSMVFGNDISEGEGSDRTHSIPEGAEIIGVSYPGLHLWITEGKVPCVVDEGKKRITQTVCDEVIALRQAHSSRDWWFHASWYRGAPPEAKDEAAAESIGDGQDEGEHEVLEISDDQWAIFWNQVRRGRVLHKAGKSEAACELIFAMCDEFDLL